MNKEEKTIETEEQITETEKEENEEIEETKESENEVESESDDTSENSDDETLEEEDEEESFSDEDDEDESEEEEPEFDYDDDGNVIIPGDEEQQEEPESETSENTAQKEEQNAPQETDDRDTKIAELEKRLEEAEKLNTRREKIAADALKSLGVDTNDVEGGLTKIAAEANGMSEEEYQNKRNEEEQAARAKAETARDNYRTQMANDLAEIRKSYPEANDWKSLLDMPNLAEFAKLRKSMSAKQAYFTANADSIVRNAEERGREKAANTGKAHLQPVSNKAAKDTSIHISRQEMEMYRELFPNDSDEEIIKTYKNLTKKERMKK